MELKNISFLDYHYSFKLKLFSKVKLLGITSAATESDFIMS